MILVNVLLGFLQFFRAIPIMNPLPWFMILYIMIHRYIDIKTVYLYIQYFLTDAVVVYYG